MYVDFGVKTIVVLGGIEVPLNVVVRHTWAEDPESTRHAYHEVYDEDGYWDQCEWDMPSEEKPYWVRSDNTTLAADLAASWEIPDSLQSGWELAGVVPLFPV